MKKIIVSIAFLAAGLFSQAQVLPSLLIPFDASSPAASVVMPSEGASSEANDAAVVLLPAHYNAWAGFSSWAPAAVACNILSAGASARIGDKMAFGLSYRSFKDQPYEIKNSTGSGTTMYSPADMFLSLSFSYATTDKLGLGMKLRYVTSAIGPELKGTAFCADLSAYYKNGCWSAGAGLFNIGSKIDWGADKYSLPAVAKAGAAYELGAFKAGMEAEYLLEGAFGASAAAEYCIAGIASAKAGYHYGNKEKGLASFASAGLGVKYFGVSLNAAYLFASETLGGSWMVGLGYSF